MKKHSDSHPPGSMIIVADRRHFIELLGVHECLFDDTRVNEQDLYVLANQPGFERVSLVFDRQSTPPLNVIPTDRQRVAASECLAGYRLPLRLLRNYTPSPIQRMRELYAVKLFCAA